ncbi:hypothetical protein N0V85_009039 [Neurospora sp. IMI 360204]|nr:hypothetical protein N0V85_009039 [Neurospora sp. IMI 360204]
MASTTLNTYTFLTYNSELRLLICSACRYALILSRLDSHLRIQHSLSKKAREPFLAWAIGLTPKPIDAEAELSAVKFPRVLQPIQSLGPIQRNGLRCSYTPETCFYIGSTPKKLREHLTQAHGWVNSIRGRGKPSKGPAGSTTGPYEGLWVEGVPYTRLFTSGSHSYLFEVVDLTPTTKVLDSASTPPATQQSSLPPTSSIEDLVRQFEAPATALRNEEQRRIREKGDFLEPNAWLLPTADPALLRESSILDAIFSAFDRVIVEGRPQLRPGGASYQVLFELARQATSKDPRKPFYFYHRDSTAKAYSKIYKRFFTYTYRTIRKDLAERPPYRPSESLLHAWDQVVIRAEEFHAQFPSYEYTPLFSTSTREEGSQDRALNAALERISASLLEYILEVFRQPLFHSEYDSLLVSFLSATALQANYTWEEPWTFTKKLSAVTTLFKVVYYVYFSRLRTERIQARIRSGEREDEADYAEPSLLELLVDNQGLYLIESSVTRLPPNAYRWATKLRNYGRTISANTARPGYVSWEGDTILYKDIRLAIPQLFETVSLALQRAQEVLFSDLLFDAPTEATRPISILYPGIGLRYKSTLPSIPWGSLGDDLNNSELGYSLASLFFDHDPSSKSWLFRRITSSTQYTRWFPGSSSTSSTPAGALDPSWLDIRVLREYSASIGRFLEYLAFLVHVTGGQAGRGTELLSLRFKNTQEGGLRNVFLDRGLIMLATGYHKGYNHSGYTKVVYRFLPKAVGELLILRASHKAVGLYRATTSTLKALARKRA